MNPGIANDPEFSDLKAQCQSVFPTLGDKLDLWAKHHQTVSTFEKALEPWDHQVVSESIDKTKESADAIDSLTPEIFALSQTLFGSLAILQKRYPSVGGDDLLNVLGIKEQYRPMTKTWGLFIESLYRKRNK